MNGEKSLSRDKLTYVRTTPLTSNHAAMAELKASDLVLDLMVLLFSPEQQEILESGTKVLLAVEPPKVLARLVPMEDRARVLAAASVLERSGEMHVTSAAGTDLRWLSASIRYSRNTASSTSRGAETIGRLNVQAGYITHISGGVDADLLTDYMDLFDDHEAYALSHVGWVCSGARWSVLGLYQREATIGMDARALVGNFLFSFGPNTEAGGTRDTPCHIDIPMCRCMVSLDGREVVQEGHVVDESALA